MWWNEWYIYLVGTVGFGAMFLGVWRAVDSVCDRKRGARKKEAEQKAGEQRRGDFVTVFGFEPSGMPVLKEAEQDQVDRVLHDLALKLHLAYGVQKKLFAAPFLHAFSNFRDAQMKRIQDLEKAEAKVAEAKSAFWDEAWDLAKYLGFRVAGKYSAYLTPEELVRI